MLTLRTEERPHSAFECMKYKREMRVPHALSDLLMKIIIIVGLEDHLGVTMIEMF